MQFRLRVDAAEGSPGVLDLYRWLTEDPDVAGAAEVALVDEEDRGDTLGGLEAISTVVSNLTSLGSLLLAVATWRDARGCGADTRVERDGVSLRVESTDPETIRRLLRQLESPVGSQPPEESPDNSGRPDDSDHPGNSDHPENPA
ncbi:effector-associated constant component EACC1 [Streptomyces sp. Inha503]|uniref:effector-associated constant component EACC1 n=1 Tax=Streptomyces sp. Inha503 TaxID=3383314 RepID=UPI0039A28A19